MVAQIINFFFVQSFHCFKKNMLTDCILNIHCNCSLKRLRYIWASRASLTYEILMFLSFSVIVRYGGHAPLRCLRSRKRQNPVFWEDFYLINYSLQYFLFWAGPSPSSHQHTHCGVGAPQTVPHVY